MASLPSLLYWLPLLWLRFWAKLVLWRVKPFIIGVTGSAGKSSAIAAIALVAALKFPRLKVAGKANSESGIPADILGLNFGKSAHPLLDWLRICLLAPVKSISSIIHHPLSMFDCYLVEMGIDEPNPPKNMSYLLTIIEPHIGIVLNALPVHTQQFEAGLGFSDKEDLIAQIANEKGKLVTQNPHLQYAILNADQPEIAAMKPGNDARVLTFGEKQDANVVIQSLKPSFEGTSLAFLIQGFGPSLAGSGLIRLPHLALPYFYGQTLASALAAGLALGVDPKQAGSVIAEKFVLPPGRGQLLKGIKGTTIIDSSYNASPVTMRQTLKLLRRVARGNSTLAILGDMRELGTLAQREHLEVANSAAKNADRVVLVGPLMEKYALPILQKQKFPVSWFATAGQAGRFVKKSLAGGEIILVKGSQDTIFLEIVVEALLKNPDEIGRLCRRGPFWDAQRKPYR